MDYTEYENECKRIEKENEAYLELFQIALEKKGLTEKTIHRHLSNVEFYLNTFNVREEADHMPAGCYKLQDFFGYFFIRKCMWSTPGSIKSTSSSLKKFYKCMLENNKIDKDDYKVVTETIKDNMEEWIEICREYNDPDQINPFMFL